MRGATIRHKPVEIDAAIHVRDVHVVAAPAELRREIGELPLRTASGQRKNRMQDSHSLFGPPNGPENHTGREARQPPQSDRRMSAKRAGIKTSSTHAVVSRQRIGENGQ